MRAGLEMPKSCWWLLKLANTSTISREWIALQHAHLMPFSDILLSGRARAAPESKHLDMPPGMRAAVERECNTSQVLSDRPAAGIGMHSCACKRAREPVVCA